MLIDKKKNFKKNVFWGVVNKFVLMICPFAVRTVIIWKLGIEYVGLGSLFTSILQVLSLAELGLGSAIVYSMYKPIAENDGMLICALLNMYKKIYTVIGCVILGVGLLIFPFLPRLIAGEVPSDINIYILFLIFVLNNVLSYFMYAYKQSLLLAHQRNDVESNISTLANVIMYVFQIIALLVTSSYYAYAIFLPICTIIINVLRNRKVREMYPQYECKGKLPREIVIDIKKRVYGIALTRICQVCRNSFDSIIISSFLGLIVLGRYQNYYYIMNTIIGFLTIITTSIVGGIGNDIVTKTKKENYKRFLSFMFGYNWISSWCTVCLLCLFQPFMKLWVGSKNMFSFTLVILLCIYFYSLKVGDVVSVYKEATGIFWEDRYRPVVESIVNLILNIGLVLVWGVYGVVLSTILSITLINIPWSAKVLFDSYFYISPRKYFGKVIRNVVNLLVACTVTYWICHLVTWNGIFEIVIKMLICIIIPNIIFVLLNKDNEVIKNMFVKVCGKL